MNIYLVSQDTVTGYELYDSMVVVAGSEDEALDIHPTDQTLDPEERLKNLKEFQHLNDYGLTRQRCDVWCARKADVDVILLGVADPDFYEEAQIIITSFNGVEL